jgi:hypothetical protein
MGNAADKEAADNTVRAVAADDSVTLANMLKTHARFVKETDKVFILYVLLYFNLFYILERTNFVAVGNTKKCNQMCSTFDKSWGRRKSC